MSHIFNNAEPGSQLIWTVMIPNNWLTLETASQFRHFILSETSSLQIVNSHDKVFEGASVDTSILSFAMTGQKEVTIYELANRQFRLVAKNGPNAYLNLRDHIISYEVQKYTGSAKLCQKILRHGISLEDVAEVRNGIQAYTVGEGIPPQTEQMKKDRVYHSLCKKDGMWIKYVDGVDVGRYELGWSKQFVKYGPNLSRPRKKELFEGERLLIRQIPASPPYSILTSYVDEHLVNDNNSMIVLNPQPGYSVKYLMGIITVQIS
jgi:adenine-specific DNA-methyltransferase